MYTLWRIADEELVEFERECPNADAEYAMRELWLHLIRYASQQTGDTTGPHHGYRRERRSDEGLSDFGTDAYSKTIALPIFILRCGTSGRLSICGSGAPIVD